MEQPQHLVALVLLQASLLRLECRRIVASDLLVAEALRPGSDDTGIAEKIDGHKASWIVGSHR